MNERSATEQVNTLNQQLVVQAQAGNAQAFNQLIEHYTGSVYGIAWAHLHDSEAADELTQEVFLRAWLKLGDLRETSRFAPWLLRMARNMAISWLRKQQSRSTLIQLVPMDETVEETVANTDQSPRESLEKSQQQQALNQALAKLTDAERELVSLHFMESLSYREIGERLEVHHTTVGRQLEKALNVLKGLFGVNTVLPAQMPKPSSALKTRTCLLVGTAATLSPQLLSALKATAAATATTTESTKAAWFTASAVSTFLSTTTSAVSTGVIVMSITQKLAIVAAIALLGFGLYVGVSGGSLASIHQPKTANIVIPSTYDHVEQRSFFGEQTITVPTGQTWRIDVPKDNPEGISYFVLRANLNQTLSLFAEGNDGVIAVDIDPTEPIKDDGPMLTNYQIWREMNLCYVLSVSVEKAEGGMNFHLFAKNNPALLEEVAKQDDAFNRGEISQIQRNKLLFDFISKSELIPSGSLNRQAVLNLMKKEMVQ